MRERVRDFLCEMRDGYPGRIVAVMSPLAEGADRLVAEEAIALGMPLHVPLPMPRELYTRISHSPESLEQFDALCASAVEVYELPLTPGNTVASIREPGGNRARQYAQAGVFLCAHCHVLLALWDGKESRPARRHEPGRPLPPRRRDARLHAARDGEPPDAGGRRERPRLPHRRARGTGPTARRPRASAARGVLVHHRRAAARAAARCRGGTAQVFARANEFSQDAQRNAAGIDRGALSAADGRAGRILPSGLRDINQVFCAADWLAIHYQKRVLFTLRVTHVCALLTGLAYISYTDLQSQRDPDRRDARPDGGRGRRRAFSRTAGRGTASTWTTARSPRACACSSTGRPPA